MEGGIVDHVVASVEIPLEHVTLVVTDFTEEYGDWSMLKARIHWIGRTEEDWTVATAQVTLRITDPSLTIIGKNALEWLSNLYKLDCPHVQVLRTESVANCRNLISISLPRVSSMDVGVFAECGALTTVSLPNAPFIGEYAFEYCTSLRDIVISPDGVEYAKGCFYGALSLEALTACSDFTIFADGEDSTYDISQYVDWRTRMDSCRIQFRSLTFALALCNRVLQSTGQLRATLCTPLSHFMCENEDVASHILSFLGAKRGKGDLRNASKEELLAAALELHALRPEINDLNMNFWGVRVDDAGQVLEVRSDG